MDKGF